MFGFLGSLHFVVRGMEWQIEWYYGNKLEQYSVLYAGVMMLHIYNMSGFSGFLGFIMLKTIRNVVKNLATMDSWMIKRCCSDPELNIYDLGIVNNWVSAFGTNPVLWFSTDPPTKFSVPLGPKFEVQPDSLFNQ
jgi:hypothetical protein